MTSYRQEVICLNQSYKQKSTFQISKGIIQYLNTLALMSLRPLQNLCTVIGKISWLTGVSCPDLGFENCIMNTSKMKATIAELTRDNVLLDPQQQGNIYIVGSILLVSNFMQKKQNMCHAVQKIFLKKSISGPKFDLLIPGGPEQVFLRIGYTSFEMP